MKGVFGVETLLVVVVGVIINVVFSLIVLPIKFAVSNIMLKSEISLQPHDKDH